MPRNREIQLSLRELDQRCRRMAAATPKPAKRNHLLALAETYDAEAEPLTSLTPAGFLSKPARNNPAPRPFHHNADACLAALILLSSRLSQTRLTSPAPAGLLSLELIWLPAFQPVQQVRQVVGILEDEPALRHVVDLRHFAAGRIDHGPETRSRLEPDVVGHRAV
jgi:hypothetical protein